MAGCIQMGLYTVQTELPQTCQGIAAGSAALMTWVAWYWCRGWPGAGPKGRHMTMTSAHLEYRRRYYQYLR